MNELALTESPSLRAQYADRVEVLDKVKALSLLPDGSHADIAGVAGYYEVDIDGIESTLRRNREDFESCGMKKLQRADLAAFKRAYPQYRLHPHTRSLNIFTREAVVHFALLLQDSAVAVRVAGLLGQVRRRYQTSKEFETLAVISRAFSHLQQSRQHRVGRYRLDLYLPQLNIAVECDEYGHADREPQQERDRQRLIENALGCTFVRFNPDAEGFNVGDVLNEILLTARPRREKPDYALFGSDS